MASRDTSATRPGRPLRGHLASPAAAAFVLAPSAGQPADHLLVGGRIIDCGAKLVFDEVTTGFRLRLGGAHLDYGVEPDMFCFGKKTQVCGFASNDRILDIDDNVFNREGDAFWVKGESTADIL